MMFADFTTAMPHVTAGALRALAISPDGAQAISGSFDTSAIRWSLQRNAAEQVLRFHDGAVNAVAFLPDGRVATSGEDARIACEGRGIARDRDEQRDFG